MRGVQRQNNRNLKIRKLLLWRAVATRRNQNRKVDRPDGGVQGRRVGATAVRELEYKMMTFGICLAFLLR